MQPEMTIELGERYRYAAYPDAEYFDYLKDYEWDSWGLYTIAIEKRYNRPALDTFGINDRLATVQEHYEFSWNSKTLETELQKAASRAGYKSQWLSLQGYSQGEWAYVLLYWREDYLQDPSGLIQELQAWWRGDVYWIALEKLETYTSATGNTIERWELVDSLSQVIIHDDNPFTLDTCEGYLGKAELSEVA